MFLGKYDTILMWLKMKFLSLVFFIKTHPLPLKQYSRSLLHFQPQIRSWSPFTILILTSHLAPHLSHHPDTSYGYNQLIFYSKSQHLHSSLMDLIESGKYFCCPVVGLNFIMIDCRKGDYLSLFITAHHHPHHQTDLSQYHFHQSHLVPNSLFHCPLPVLLKNDFLSKFDSNFDIFIVWFFLHPFLFISIWDEY